MKKWGAERGENGKSNCSGKAASWGSLTPSVCGGEIGAEKARCLDWVCGKCDISLYGSAITKKLSDTGGRPVPPAYAGACGQDGGKG